jgi:hypothetical protein
MTLRRRKPLAENFSVFAFAFAFAFRKAFALSVAKTLVTSSDSAVTALPCAASDSEAALLSRQAIAQPLLLLSFAFREALSALSASENALHQRRSFGNCSPCAASDSEAALLSRQAIAQPLLSATTGVELLRQAIAKLLLPVVSATCRLTIRRIGRDRRHHPMTFGTRKVGK